MVLEGLSGSLDVGLMKGGIFVIVQALVCLIILSSSSDVFSTKMRSLSFKASRSMGRIFEGLSDVSFGDGPSPSSRNLRSWGGDISKAVKKD